MTTKEPKLEKKKLRRMGRWMAQTRKKTAENMVKA